MSLLDEVRKKKLHERKIIALALAGLIVAIIFFVWATTLVATFSSVDTDTDVAEEPQKEESGIIASLKRQVSLILEGAEGLPDFIEPNPLTYIQEEIENTGTSSLDIEEALERFASSTEEVDFDALVDELFDENAE